MVDDVQRRGDPDAAGHEDEVVELEGGVVGGRVGAGDPARALGVPLRQAVVEGPGPVAHAADVHARAGAVRGVREEGEGVPLPCGEPRDAEQDVPAAVEPFGVVEAELDAGLQAGELARFDHVGLEQESVEHVQPVQLWEEGEAWPCRVIDGGG